MAVQSLGNNYSLLLCYGMWYILKTIYVVPYNLALYGITFSMVWGGMVYGTR
jgi:hypothetical protein